MTQTLANIVAKFRHLQLQSTAVGPPEEGVKNVYNISLGSFRYFVKMKLINCQCQLWM
jgi:hypothetical protein